MKYASGIRSRFRDAPAFTVRDLKVFLEGKKIGEAYLHLLVHNMLASGELKRITRGVYTFRDDVQVAGFGFTPFYYGLQDALSLHGFWEQEANPVIITPRRVRQGVREFNGRNFVLRRIERKMFFGFSMQRSSGLWIPVSDPEKTLIDFAYYREPLGKDALAALSEKIDRKRLAAYLARSPARVRRRVRGMLSALGRRRPARVL